MSRLSKDHWEIVVAVGFDGDCVLMHGLSSMQYEYVKEDILISFDELEDEVLDVLPGIYNVEARYVTVGDDRWDGEMAFKLLKPALYRINLS